MDLLRERPEIISVIEKVALEQGIEHCVINNVKTNEEGEGNLGEIFMVTVKDRINLKSLDVVVKAAPVDETIRSSQPIEEAFLNEIFFYTQIHPIFKKLEAEHAISVSNLVPKCYGTLSKKGNEMLCLENMKTANFEMFNKRSLWDNDHICLLFKAYGRFHAYSVALQDQKPEEYERLVSKLYNVYTEFLDRPSGNVKQYLNGISNLVENYLVPGEDDEIIKKFRKYHDNGIVEQINEVVTAECDYSVILHGDCWSNNMIFKYEMCDGVKKPVDVCLLDLQVVKKGSPVCDLSYCLYSGASTMAFYRLDEYLKIYHESFSSFLKKLGSDSEKVIPFEVLKEHWRKYSKFGLIMSVGVQKMKSTRREVVQEPTSDDDSTMQNVTREVLDEEEFKGKIRDLLRHMSEIEAL